MVRKVLLVTVIMALMISVLALTGCNAEAAEGNTAMDARTTTPSVPPLPTPTPEPQLDILDGTVLEELRENPVVLLQLQPVQAGEELAVVHTSMGDVTLRFFPEEAPMAVENFVTHARNGYYDGLTFHRVIPNFMIQGGCPIGNGTGGESIWGGTFGQEFSFNLRHFRGALAMAQSAMPNSIGSQFYIVQAFDLDPNTHASFQFFYENQDEPIGIFSDGQRLYFRDVHTPQELQHFMQYGGTPHLDWYFNPNGHTVFGHVVEGMDIVDAIANVSRGANDSPSEPIIIERISFIVYGG
jgi:peptidyl-prolyl cis-trans isomerase B (cyclophilin B)